MFALRYIEMYILLSIMHLFGIGIAQTVKMTKMKSLNLEKNSRKQLTNLIRRPRIGEKVCKLFARWYADLMI